MPTKPFCIFRLLEIKMDEEFERPTLNKDFYLIMGQP